ncbi:MAG: hypothetical protein Q7S33_02665 [Nanoarchaeota archaeon]|nr:hypothetical protein [Nanoarchaeota archaeon]
MQIKLLKGLIDELAGEGAGQIADILFEKRDVNEFLIAKKMNLTINQVRNILYKLSADGLVSFTRKKDKRKGWYIYYWTLDSEKCLIQIEDSLLKKIEEFNHQLKNRETKRYYSCKPCNVEVNEETALEHDFICEECAEVYVLSDNTPELKDIQLKIARTEKELKVIRDELEIIRAVSAKKKVSREKKELKEKTEKKQKDRAQRKKDKAKAEKKFPPKKVKKSVVKSKKKK